MLTIDCMGLRCPMPLLKAKLAYADLAPGDAFQLVADDPAAGPDIQRWAQRVQANYALKNADPLTIEVTKQRA